MTELPYMPLRVQDLVADTTGMSIGEFGGYIRILCALWANGGLLPHNDKQLRRIAGASPREWGSVKPAIFDKLIVAEGKISQKRLTETRLRVQEIRRKRATASLSRWGKNDKNSTFKGRVLELNKWPNPLK